MINYELPEIPEIYVHRIGRTGRAGASGIATSFCGGEERDRLKRIERLTRRSILVEQEAQLGGMALNLTKTIEGADIGAYRFITCQPAESFDRPRPGARPGRVDL